MNPFLLKHWLWVPGMRVQCMVPGQTNTWWRVGYMAIQDVLVLTDCEAPRQIVDLSTNMPIAIDDTDPATKGCLLFLVRRAYDAPWIDVVCEYAPPENEQPYVWRVNVPEGETHSDTEFGAMLKALEQAP